MSKKIYPMQGRSSHARGAAKTSGNGGFVPRVEPSVARMLLNRNPKKKVRNKSAKLRRVQNSE